MAPAGSQVERIDSSGYESPDENCQPPFVTPPSGTPAATPLPNDETAQTSNLVPPSTSGTRTNADSREASQAHRRKGENSHGSSLNNVLANMDRTGRGKKVGIRDRLACHQWTWFAMVRFELQNPEDLMLMNTDYGTLRSSPPHHVSRPSLTSSQATGGVANVLHSCESLISRSQVPRTD